MKTKVKNLEEKASVPAAELPDDENVEAFQGIPVYLKHNPDLLHWEDLRPGVGGISEETCLFYDNESGSVLPEYEDKFLSLLRALAETKKATLFKNCEQLFTDIYHSTECDFYPKDTEKLTRAEKYDFIEKLLSPYGRTWFDDIRAYAEVVCLHAQIPFYTKEIVDHHKGIAHDLIAFSGTGKKLNRKETALFARQAIEVERWLNGSCYDVAVPSAHEAVGMTHYILPTGFEFSLRGGKNPLHVLVQDDINYLLKNKKGDLAVYLPYATKISGGESVEFSTRKHVKVRVESQKQVDNLLEFYEMLGYKAPIKIKNLSEHQR